MAVPPFFTGILISWLPWEPAAPAPAGGTGRKRPGFRFQSTVVGVDASNMTARAMLERFVSTASRDFINYNNADYDALFAQAQACYDDEEQTALYISVRSASTFSGVACVPPHLCSGSFHYPLYEISDEQRTF